MGYVKRKGVRLNFGIVILTLFVMTLMYLFGDFESQFIILQQIQFVNIEIFSPKISVVIVYLGIGIIGSFLWYIFGKFVAPLFTTYLGLFFGGLRSKAFIDKNINDQDMGFFKFLGVVINTILIIFSLDFFLSNTIFFRNNARPTFFSLIFALLIISIFQSLHLVYDNVGIRSYNRGNAEVIGISSVLDRLIFRLLSTGGLLGVFANITRNEAIIDFIPQTLKIIFFRSVSIGVLLVSFWVIFFQPKAIIGDWEGKGISSGETKVEF